MARMELINNQNHSSDSTHSEQEVIRYTKKLAQIFGLNEKNAKVYTALSGENRALKKQLEDYHSQHNTLEKRVKKLERGVKFLETELKDLNECVDRETVVNLIHETVPSLICKKDKDSSYSSESSEDSDSVEIIERSHGYQVREKKAIPHKQRRRARPKKVKRMVV